MISVLAVVRGEYFSPDLRAFAFKGGEQLHIPAVYETSIDLRLVDSDGVMREITAVTRDMDRSNLETGIIVKSVNELAAVDPTADDTFDGGFTFE